ncbi:MAG: hypothetical protein B7Z47_00530 [Chthoniobacter sp. 12-60-6]|nr:MAG: hypothetical protein B7Z47_00530 [Chthoniobacter sp. 12-60-6]
MGWKELGRVKHMPAPRSSLWKCCLFGVLFMEMACAQHKTIQPVSNPMDAAWSEIRDGIGKLENEHAHEDDWRKASEPHPEVVSSISDLNEQTKSLEISVSEREGLPAAFNKSSRVIHFGFECNYHALVFFDEAGKSWKVIKW